MNSYYQNLDSKNIYKIYCKYEENFILYKQVIKQYFDGLWEMECDYEEIGCFKTKSECFKLMV